MKNNDRNRPVIPVPLGMANWVKSEAARLGLVFMAEVREIDATMPGHNCDEEIEVLPLSPAPHLRPV